MAALQNKRHELFVRYYMKTGVAAQAYIKAGYATTTRSALDVNASRLLRHAQVKLRIAELKRAMAQHTKVTLESLLQDLQQDRALARSLGQPSAAIGATQLMAKLCGLLVEKKEIGGPGDFSNLQSVDEIMARVTAELGTEAANLVTRALQQPEPQVIDVVAETENIASGSESLQ